MTGSNPNKLKHKLDQPYYKYCPVCGRTLTALNISEVERGEDEAYIFVHDEIPHDADDIEAISNNIN